MAGVVRSHMPVSQTSTRSAVSSARFASTHSGRCFEPSSSAPSISTVTPTGNSPWIAFQARQASRKVMTCPLSSQAPRALIARRPSGSVTRRGSKGGVSHRSSGSTGCTS